MKINAIIHPAEEGGYWAEVPALPGCITEGDSLEEVIDNLQDAITGWLEVANEYQLTNETDQIIEIAVLNLFRVKNCVKLSRKRVGLWKGLLAVITFIKSLELIEYYQFQFIETKI